MTHQTGSSATLSNRDPYDEAYQVGRLGTRPLRRIYLSASQLLNDARAIDREAVGRAVLKHRLKVMVAYVFTAGASLRFSGLDSANLYIAIALASGVLVSMGILLTVLHRRRKEQEISEV